MAVGIDGDLQLGAHTVGGSDQHRVLEPGGARIEQGSKSTKAGGSARARGGFSERLDGLNQGFAGVDIDTRILVGQARSLGRVCNGFLGGLIVLWYQPIPVGRRYFIRDGFQCFFSARASPFGPGSPPSPFSAPFS
jgi:hypothetical protein